jgi:hypothetical protein
VTYWTADFEAVSGLAFRDARPLQAGESSIARNLDFPPPPNAFWSSVRTVLRGRNLGKRNGPGTGCAARRLARSA